GGDRSALVAYWRLLESARRHADRRVLADGGAAGGPVAAGSGCRDVSFSRLSGCAWREQRANAAQLAQNLAALQEEQRAVHRCRLERDDADLGPQAYIDGAHQQAVADEQRDGSERWRRKHAEEIRDRAFDRAEVELQQPRQIEKTNERATKRDV